MKYGIRIISKYTGKNSILGSQYNSQESAMKAAEKDVCMRCNRWELVYIHKPSIWKDRHIGFVPIKDT